MFIFNVSAGTSSLLVTEETVWRVYTVSGKNGTNNVLGISV